MKEQNSINTPAVNWALIRYRPRTFLVHSLFAILAFSMQLAPGLLFKAYFDTIGGAGATSQGGSWAAPEPGDVQLLVLLVAVFVLAEIARMVFSLGLEWYGWTFRLAVAALMRRNLFASILQRPGDQPLPVSSGEAINRFRTDVEEVADFPTWLPDQVGKWIAAGIAILIMARINLPLTLIIFLPLVGVALVTRLAWVKIIQYDRLSRSATDAVTGFIGQAFGAAQSIKLATAEKNVRAHLEVLNQSRQDAEIRLQVTWNVLNSLNSSLVTFGIGLMMLMAGQAITNGIFSVGDFVLFVSFLNFTTQVPSELGTFYGDYKTQAISINRMVELIRPEAAKTLIVPHPFYEKGAIPLPKFPEKNADDRLEELRVEGIGYRYPGGEGSTLLNGDKTSGVVQAGLQAPQGQPAGEEVTGTFSGKVPQGIEDITFKLKRGELLVITGEVGAGKSTLVRVICGLLPKDKGVVYWNGKPVADAGNFMRPPRCGIVLQVPRLFSETLRENILLGLPEAESDLQNAIHWSVLEEDLLGLEKGMDTLVGPRGVRLSGGQVQRAAAARTFVREPELLVLDDLSSALDVETEQLLWQRLKERRGYGAISPEKAITCLAVSHRKAALAMADRILVMKAGRVAAQGRLENLLETSPELQRLWHRET
jgi:ATP-binding cassette, subfamily B, bacterial